MSLPSTVRPQEIQEEISEKIESLKKNGLKLKVDKKKIFQAKMGAWYDDLSAPKRKSLTLKEIKRKAVSLCFTFNLVYDNLPSDWFKKFKEDHHVRFKSKRKRRKHKKDDSEGKPAKRARLNGTFSRRCVNGIANVEDIDGCRSDEDDDLFELIGTRKKSGNSDDKLMAVSSSSTSNATKSQKKKFLDLSKSLPPPLWLKAYSEGVVLPRVLTTFSTEDTNILYYDYTPKLKDSLGREIKLDLQPRHNQKVNDPLLLHIGE